MLIGLISVKKDVNTNKAYEITEFCSIGDLFFMTFIDKFPIQRKNFAL